MSATLITCLKDEAPFLIEWLAYQKIIGFKRFVVGANNCNDGSHEMLSRLAELNEIEYIPFSKEQGIGPQQTFATILTNRNIIEPDEWICWLDLDEFLNIHVGNGRVGDLLALIENIDGIRLNWRIFGADAAQPWPGRQLHPELCRCSEENFGLEGPYHANKTFKSLFRYAEGMGLWCHGPILNREHITKKPTWWRGNGKVIRKARWPYLMVKQVEGGPGKSYLPGPPTYQWAQVNHYATRHPDLEYLRRLRGRGGTFVPADKNRPGADDFTDRYSDAYFLRYNKTDEEERSILRYIPEVDTEMARLLSDETLQHWHQHATQEMQANMGKQKSLQC